MTCSQIRVNTDCCSPRSEAAAAQLPVQPCRSRAGSRRGGQRGGRNGAGRAGRGVTAAFGRQDDLNHLDVHYIFHVERRRDVIPDPVWQ